MEYSSLLSVGGLILDLIGVGLLGVDLIRVQRRVLASASGAKNDLESFLIDYGHLPESLSELEGKTRRISLHEYWDNHSEDEASYNVNVLFGKVKELAINVEEVAHWTRLMVEFHKEQSQSEKQLMNSTIKFSVLGLTLILVGFGMQIASFFV